MSWEHRFEKYAARVVAGLPPKAARRVTRSIRIDGQTLDPQLQLVLAVNKHKGFDKLGGVAEARARYRHIATILDAPAKPPHVLENRTLSTDSGPVPVRIYQPSGAANRPAIVFFHGGGYTIGDLETHDGLCRRFCREVVATVVSVDYRLSPEHPFPAGVDDCAAVTRWVLANAESIGVDAARVALAGDSAGGNYAAIVSQEVPGIAFQLLIYPGTEARYRTRSRDRFGEGFGLDNSTVDWFFDSYALETPSDHPRISPAASPNLAASPTTHIAIAGFDVLRDEGREYADLLQKAGVECSLECHGTLGHGFVHLTRLPACNAAVASLVRALRRGLGVARG